MSLVINDRPMRSFYGLSGCNACGGGLGAIDPIEEMFPTNLAPEYYEPGGGIDWDKVFDRLERGIAIGNSALESLWRNLDAAGKRKVANDVYQRVQGTNVAPWMWGLIALGAAALFLKR